MYAYMCARIRKYELYKIILDLLYIYLTDDFETDQLSFNQLCELHNH